MPNPPIRRRPPVRPAVVGSHSPAPAPQVTLSRGLPRPLVGMLAGAGAAVLGWSVVALISFAVWLTVVRASVTGAMGVATQLWLAALGGGATIAGQTITLIPLGATLGQVIVVRVIATSALRFWGLGEWDLGRQLGSVAAGHAVVATVLSLITGAGGRTAAACGGAAVVGCLGAAWAVLRVRSKEEGSPDLPWPAWAGPLRGSARPVAAGLLVLGAGASLLLVGALIAGAPRILAIEASLRPDAVGSVVLVLITIAYLPNLVIWSLSYAFGAGFSLGGSSMITPAFSQVGLLPAIPVLGAVPGGGSPWLYLLVLIGVGAGVACALVARADVDLPRHVGQAAVAAALVSLVVIVSGWLASGALGDDHLAGLGPRLAALAWMAPLGLLTGGTVAALIRWFLRSRHAPPSATPTEVDQQETMPLGV